MVREAWAGEDIDRLRFAEGVGRRSSVVDEELLHSRHADQKREPKVVLGADGDAVILEVLVLDQEVICLAHVWSGKSQKPK